MPVSPDVPSRSPWIAQLAPDGPARPLQTDTDTDVVVVGAGIAGVATAFFVLRHTDHSVLLLERGRVARGATGRNAGQLTTYFERPLTDIAEEFGEQLAIEAQRNIDDAHGLLDLMVAEAGVTSRIERFTGQMGMFALNHLEVHLRDNLLRARGGLRVAQVFVSEEAEFLHEIPERYRALYRVVPQSAVCEMLGLTDSRYRAVLCEPKGCGNSALLSQQVLEYLERTAPHRFRYADHTMVERVELAEGGATVRAGGHTVTSRRVVLCTNGFDDHLVVHADGQQAEGDVHLTRTVGFMGAFAEHPLRPPAATSYIINSTIGGDSPYLYVTRRTYDRADDTVTLTCMGGPETILDDDQSYDEQAAFPGERVQEMGRVRQRFGQPGSAGDEPLDYTWHGLMGYTDDRIRRIGPDPRNPVLLYNLGCNGIGFLPSIHGGRRVASILAGDDLPASIFDPR